VYLFWNEWLEQFFLFGCLLVHIFGIGIGSEELLCHDCFLLFMTSQLLLLFWHDQMGVDERS
jgi:hypothetical protein